MPNYRKLIRRLSTLYSDKGSAQVVLRFAEIETGRIDMSGSPQVMWMNIIDEVKKQNQLDSLIQMVVEEYPDDEKLFEYIKEETAVVPLKDASKFYKSELNIDKNKLKALVEANKLDDALTKLKLIGEELSSSYANQVTGLTSRFNALKQDQHAGLIRYDDFKFERNKIAHAINYLIDEIDNEKHIQDIMNDMSPAQPKLETPTGINVIDRSDFEKIMRGRDNIVPIEWLSKAVERSKIVCKVELSTGGSGTGFLIKGGYVLTNHHVICKHFPFLQSPCDFSCKTDNSCPIRGRILLNDQASANANDKIPYELDPADTYIVNKDLDYALIKIKDNPAHPLSKWGHAEIEAFKLPQKDDLVNIIQHPGGKMKMIAMPDVVLNNWQEKNYLFYMADTKPGSSGSPVFNQDWKVVALHHAGKNEKSSGGGITINANGDVHPANRGILIGAIQRDLATHGISI